MKIIQQIESFFLKPVLINPKFLAKLILLVAFASKVYFIIWQFSFFKFIIAPGGDPVNHLSFVQKIIDGNFNIHEYPPLYHYIIAWVSQFSHTDPIFVMKYSAIILLFLPIPFFYFLAKELFGFWSGFWATLIYLMVSSHPLLNFVDGNYPGILNTGVFIPIVFIYYLRSFKSVSLVNVGLTALFSILMIFTHHLTAIIALLTMALFLVVYGLSLLFQVNKELKTEYRKFIVTYGVVGAMLWFGISLTFGPGLVGAFGTILSGGSPVSNPVFARVPEFSELANLLSPLVEFFGIGGLIIAIATYSSRTRQKLFVIIWVLVLWLLSRNSLFGLPPRFLREISVPATILAGYLVANVIYFSKAGFQKAIIAGLVGYVLIMNAVQVYMPPFSLPNGFQDMVWYHKVDQEKVDYIKDKIPAGSVILANPSNPYLSYFINRATNNKITYKVISSIPMNIPFKKLTSAEKTTLATNFINAQSADYLFIGSPPTPDPDEKTFSEFIGYRDITDIFKEYPHKQNEIIKTFKDGSRIINLNHPKQKN